jgi:hypothetical protein
MQAPPDFLAAGAIVALSSAVGRRATIRPKERDDWTVVPNLWGGIIGRPSLLKTPSLDEVMRPLKKLETDAAASHREALEEYETAKRVHSAMKSEIDKEIRKAVKEGRDASAILQKHSEGDQPARVRYIVPDATPEALGEILQANPNGVLVFRDELMGWLSGLDKEGREDARTFYLEGWNGFGSFGSDRIGRGNIFIPSVCLSILGGVQPSKLAPYVRAAVKGGAGDDGLLQRFQVLVYPDAPTTWRNVDRIPNHQSREAAHAVYTRLATTNPEVEPRRFDPAAQALFNEWRADLENRLRTGGLHPALEAHLAKYRKLMPALSLLLALADGIDGPVPVEYAQRAAAWCEYLEGHANRVYSVAISGDAATAKLIAAKLKAGALTDGFKLRDIYRHGWAGLTDREDIQKGLDLLEDFEWLSSEVTFSEVGGRPTSIYKINPRLPEVFA